MSQLHCLLLIHGESIEEMRRNIIAAAEEVDQQYAIMGDRANCTYGEGEFEFVKDESLGRVFKTMAQGL